MTTKLSRRQALRLALLSGFGGLVAACTSTANPAATSGQSPQPAVPPAASVANTSTPASSTALPAKAPATTGAAAPTAVAMPEAPSATLGSEIAQAAMLLLVALDGDARSKATYAFGDSERQRWHWTTPSGFPRNGLPLRDMTSDQRTLALALLRASVSEAGYQKALDIMSLQRELGNDPDLYYVTVFGTPGAAESWGWRFEGHHLSRNFTIMGEQVSATPFFNGAWPTATDAGMRAMAREEDAARELVSSLDDSRRAVAIFQTRTLTNHVTQNQPYVRPLDPVGIALGDIAADQRKLALEIIQTYLGVLPESIATPSFERISGAGIENIRFGWAGSLAPRRPQYYRLQGPTFLLEFDNSRNGGTHIHSVWRDFEGDFGQQLS